MSPDRLTAAVEQIKAAASEVRAEIKVERSTRRWWNAVTTVALVAIFLLALWNWNTRADQHHDDCVKSNEAKASLRNAFGDDHQSLEEVVAAAVGTSKEGKAFIVQLEASHKSVEAHLARTLPLESC